MKPWFAHWTAARAPPPPTARSTRRRLTAALYETTRSNQVNAFIDILIYTCLSVMGFVRLMLNFGTIPTLPIRSNHNKEALKKAYVVGSRINFMINATRFGLQSNAKELSIIQNRLRNIFAFREGYSFGLRLIDYRLLGFLEEDKCSPRC